MKDCAALNRIYRVVWNRARGLWIVASEHARGLGQGSGRRKLSLKDMVTLVSLSLFSSLTIAAPTGGQVTAGSGTIAQSGATTTINQSSQNLSLSWKTFNVASTETVNFAQPNSSALAVNRIYDTQGSQVLGHLNANGQIYLINPNGILFGKSAQLNVGGLVASTLDTADGSHFAGNGTGSVVNEGTINASHYVALLGDSVTNSGVITARLGTVGGTVAMGAGNDVSLTFSGNQLVKLQVNKSVINSLVANHGLIKADGGMVIMNAGARDTLLASVVNNDGVVQAQTVQNQNGTITLLGSMVAGTVNVGGTLDASAPNGGNGGAIETSAAHVHVANDAKVTTLAANGASGTWLLDPVDFTIAATGGDITGAAVGTALAGGNFTILSSNGGSGTAGDINVKDAVTWSAHTLTLNAQNNVNINANLDGSGGGSLALLYGQSSSGGGSSNYYISNGASVSLPAGSNFSTQLGSGGATTSYTVITNLGSAGSVTTTDLQGMSGNLAGNYALGANIDATATSGWGSGFAPVGALATQFTGSLAGLGHTISNLTINRLSTPYVGLFGYSTGTLRDVGLLNSSISGQEAVGALAGYSNGAISYSYADGGNVTVDTNIAGGLVGQINGSISDSYATDSVTGNSNGVSSTALGGLVGSVLSGASINNSYATGSVNGGTDVGGLVGQNAGAITDAYSTGAVTWATSGGGLLSLNSGSGTVNNCYWDTTTSGTSSSAAGTGEITTNMQKYATFSSNWSIADSGGAGKTWRIYDGYSYPLLSNFLTSLTVTANAASKTYDGAAFSGGNGVSDSVTTNSTLLGSASYSGTSQGAVNAGSYTITPSGFYSTSQSGFDVSYADGTLTVNKATLTATITASNKTYDGGTMATPAFTITGGLVGSETVTASGTASFSDKNVGTGKTVTANTVNLADGTNGGLASNYTLSAGQKTTANITAAPLTISGITASNKTYDGTTTATVNTSAATYTGLVSGDAVTVSATGAFANKNVGTGKTVTLTSSYTGADVNNYSITGQASTTADITAVPLTITASNASKAYDGTAYSGGNGVSYSGFIGGDTSAVLGGTLTYGGSAQGAVNAGSYTIIPSGLTSGNYGISYADGTLTIYPGALSPDVMSADTGALSVLNSPSLVQQGQSGTLGASMGNGSASGNAPVSPNPDFNGQGAGSNSLSLKVVDGGVRLPPDSM